MLNSSSLKELMKSSEFDSLSRDYLKVVSDIIITNENIKRIPVIDTIYTIFRLSQDMSDRIFAKKIMSFLFGYSPFNQNAINDFYFKHNEKEIGEKIILILNQLDDIKKAEIIGRLFKATIESKVDKDTFFRCCYAVNRCFLTDLDWLKINQYSIKSDNESMLISLVDSMLIKENIGMQSVEDYESKINHHITLIGKLVLKYGLEEPNSDL